MTAIDYVILTVALTALANSGLALYFIYRMCLFLAGPICLTKVEDWKGG